MPFTPGSPSSLPTRIIADIHTQPSKTSVSESAQGQRVAGDARGFRTPTSASARRSGRPTRHSSARGARLFLGRPVGGECRGGEVSSTNNREIDRNPLPPRISSGALHCWSKSSSHSVCCCSKDSSTALAGSSFSFCFVYCFLYLLHLCKLAKTFSIPHGYSSQGICVSWEGCEVCGPSTSTGQH